MNSRYAPGPSRACGFATIEPFILSANAPLYSEGDFSISFYLVGSEGKTGFFFRKGKKSHLQVDESEIHEKRGLVLLSIPRWHGRTERAS